MKIESKSKFEHVGERLRRYQPSGVYFAWVRHKGKLFRESLKTTDKITAKRLLREFVAKLEKLDVGAGNVTLTELCDRYLATIQNQQPSTVEWKSGVVKRLKADWTDGPYVRVSEIRASQVKSWLASYKFSYASYNHHLSVIRAVFQIAVDDHILVESPVETLKAQKPGKPIRQTPSWEQFKQIVADIRSHPPSRQEDESPFCFGELDDHQFDGMLLGLLCGVLAGVSLIDKGHLHLLLGRLLNLLA